MKPADVKELRLALNWTQDELATHIGVNRSSVSRYETDLEPRGPALKMLQKLASEFARGRRRPRTDRPRIGPRGRKPQSEALADVG